MTTIHNNMSESIATTTVSSSFIVPVDPTVISSKRVIFVSGLANEATIQLVRAAMIPFGPIRSVDMPMDYIKGQHRGFAFVEFEDPDDAEEAIFNMDGSELLDRTIQVNIAQTNQIHKLSGSNTAGSSNSTATNANSSTEAVWKSDEWFQQYSGSNGGQDNESIKKQQELNDDVAALKALK